VEVEHISDNVAVFSGLIFHEQISAVSCVIKPKSMVLVVVVLVVVVVVVMLCWCHLVVVDWW